MTQVYATLRIPSVATEKRSMGDKPRRVDVEQWREKMLLKIEHQFELKRDVARQLQEKMEEEKRLMELEIERIREADRVNGTRVLLDALIAAAASTDEELERFDAEILEKHPQLADFKHMVKFPDRRKNINAHLAQEQQAHAQNQQESAIKSE